jgi:Ca-activated chloride channel homolog
MISPACALTGTRNEQIALSDVAVRATLRDLLCEVSVTQVYRNQEEAPIEAVYTFPLPLDAVLLDLEVALGGRVLHGSVVEKASAEAQYEGAIDRGDSAVLLQQLEPGLWTMNVGNLLPGELARITVRYALMHRWDGDRLRLLFPTTIAPRYGASPHAPHQAPEQALTVENHFSFEVEVAGDLRGAQFSSPSHSLHLQREGAVTTLSLRQARAVMDRDVVLQVRAPQAARGCALGGPDGNGTAVVALFHPFFPGLRQSQPLQLAIVVDCSGSMQGDSMLLARRALDDVVSALRPDDRVGVIAFGNEAQVMAPHLVPCTPDGVAQSRTFVARLDATMGGTEVGRAMRAAYRLLGEARHGDVFLITDGEVSDWQDVVEEAKRTGHRVFTVGVGSAVSEAFVRELARVTGGACELVSPREGMSERIVRHFERMRAPRARQVRVLWPADARDVAPSRVDAVYEGDTVFASARFDGAAAGMVVLEVETEGGEVGRSELPLPLPTAEQAAEQAPVLDDAGQTGITRAVSAPRHSTIARLAASMRLSALDASAAREVALRYQLASPYTHWLVIAERAEAEKGSELPELRKVAQTLAAGWGGFGSVTGGGGVRPAHAAPTAFDARSMPMLSEAFGCATFESAHADVSSFRDMPPYPEPAAAAPSDRGFGQDGSRLHPLVQLVNDDPSRLSLGGAATLLRDAGLADTLAELHEAASHAGISQEVVAPLLLVRELSGAPRHYLIPEALQALVELERSAELLRVQLLEAEAHGQHLEAALHALLHNQPAIGSTWAHIGHEVRDRLKALRTAVARLLE